MDWEDENWDKIWICGIFWGIVGRFYWGGGRFGVWKVGGLGEREDWGFWV